MKLTTDFKMSNKKLLIASSSRDEAITNWVLKNKPADLIIDLLFVDELLNKYDIRDELDDHKAIIRWYESNILKFSNETYCLLNRIIYLEDELWESFKTIDREYAKREFEAYLGFALNSFQTVQNIATNGICERSYSLPQQWCLVDKTINIQVPDYYWGSKNFNPYENETEVVYSTIYDYLNWSLSSHNRENRAEFCFKKPKGIPLFVLSIGLSHLITTDNVISVEQIEKVEGLLKQVRELFKYFIFELLVFVTGDILTFGCINIDVIRSQQNPLFDAFLQENLIQEYYKCLN